MHKYIVCHIGQSGMATPSLNQPNSGMPLPQGRLSSISVFSYSNELIIHKALMERLCLY